MSARAPKGSRPAPLDTVRCPLYLLTRIGEKESRGSRSFADRPREDPLCNPPGLSRVVYGLPVWIKRRENWEQRLRHTGARAGSWNCPGARGIGRAPYGNGQNIHFHSPYGAREWFVKAPIRGVWLSPYQLSIWKSQAHYNKSTGRSVHCCKDVLYYLLLINSYSIRKTYYSIMHRYHSMQYVFYMVSKTIYKHFSWLEFKWHNHLETRQPWIWITSACGLIDSDFINDEFPGHYPICNGKGWGIRGAYAEFSKVPSTFLFLVNLFFYHSQLYILCLKLFE